MKKKDIDESKLINNLVKDKQLTDLLKSKDPKELVYQIFLQAS